MWPRPIEIAARVLIAAGLILGLCHAFQRTLVKSLIPALCVVLPTVEGDFTFLSMEIATDGPNPVLQTRANLAHPIDVNGHTIYPFGWGPIPAGGYQVNLTLGGILQNCALLLILVLAWPVAQPKEFAARLLVSFPLIVVLLLIHVPFAILGELWHEIRHYWDPNGFDGLMVWNRFLMGGGGLVLGMLFGAISIAAGTRWCAIPRGTAPRRPLSLSL